MVKKKKKIFPNIEDIEDIADINLESDYPIDVKKTKKEKFLK